jgi:hypothetical protein
MTAGGLRRFGKLGQFLAQLNTHFAKILQCREGQISQQRPKPSRTALVLNGVCDSGKRGFFQQLKKKVCETIPKGCFRDLPNLLCVCAPKQGKRTLNRIAAMHQA